MPQLAGAAAAWAVTAWTSAVTVVNTAMVAAAGAALPGLSFSAQLAVANFATKAIVFGGLAAASAALMRPSTPSSGTTLDFKPDPKAPIRGAMGYTALGGNKVFQATWGYKRVAMSLGVALSLGPIDQVPRFEADGATVSFSGPQNEATGFYAADMWQRTTLGLPGDPALLPPTGLKYGNPGLTGWGTQHAAPQTAFSFWTMVLAKNPEDRDVFTNGVPDPRWIGRWMKVWQPRYDSTYPGGSGPQRRDDWRTWGWSENPYDHALAWVRGHYKLNLDGSIDRTKRIAGIGAPDSAIDIPAFVEGANIADANGWTISGEWSTGDGKFQTLLAMLQAGGGEPISRGAQISVLVNAPRVATYTYTRDDLIGQAEIRPLTPRRERKNTIIPRYKSEANGWQYVPAGEVTSSVYRDEDRGEPRSLEIEYTHVRNAKQAGQLAAYDLANLREGLTATLPSKVHLMHVHPGACITVDVPELALAGQKFIVRRATTNHQAASVTLELRSESDGKHAWALGQAAQPAPSPSLSAVDPKYVPPPAAEDWTVLPKPPGDGGVSQPIFVIEAPVETTDIVAVIIKHGPSASGPWTDGYEGSPRADGRYEVAGLTPGQTYCVSLQYVAKNGAKSDPDIKCGIVAGDLIAGDITPTAPTIVSIRNDIDAAFGDIFDVSELVGQARQAVEDLEAVYGDTVSAATSAAAAAASEAAAVQAKADTIIAKGEAQDARDEAAQKALDAAGSAAASAGSATAADNARAAAVIAKGEAQTARDTAATKATEAAGSAAAALTSKNYAAAAQTAAEAAQADAVAKALAAAGSATAASGHATTASQKADAAAGSASAAAGSATVATTKAGEASVSASKAATSETNAEGSKTAAATSATAAAASRDAAAGSASAAATSASTAGTHATNAGTSATAANTAKTAAETARGQAQTAATNAATSETNAAGSAADASSSASTAAQSKDAAAGSATAAAGSASTAATKATEAGNSAAAANAAKVAAESARDTADSKAAAAAQSASSAATSSTQAGQSASAAQTAKTDAETARAQAQTFRNEAADSATNAAGSAATASSAAGQSVTAKDQAQGFANAANTSAQNAAGSATAAGNSASAANTSKTAAEAAYSASRAAAIAGMSDVIAADTHTASQSGSPLTKAGLTPSSVANGVYTHSTPNAGTIFWKQYLPWKLGEVYDLEVAVTCDSASGAVPTAWLYGGVNDAAFAKLADRSGSAAIPTPVGQTTVLKYRVGMGVTPPGGVLWADAVGAAWAHIGIVFNRGTGLTAVSSRILRMSIRNVTALVASEGVYDKTVILGGNQGFEEGLTGWTNVVLGTTPPSNATWAATYQGRSGVAVNNKAGRSQFFTQKLYPIDTSRKYRIRGSHYVGAGSGVARVYMGFRSVGADGAVNGTNNNYCVPAGGVVPANTGWIDASSGVLTGEASGNGSSTAFGVGTKAISLMAFINYDQNPDIDTALDGIWLEDVTESEAAKAQATASATSAASAAASATLAGEKASAAQASATAADTSRGQAQTAATQASQSETNAAGSAASASSAAQNAATSRDQASGFATAASGSASTASTKANEAGNSAAAAAASQVSASAAKDAAVSAKDGAETARGQAQSSATAAATSASSASASATTAGEKAASASGSAVTAATKAGEALSYAYDAATSAANAQGAAESIATSIEGLEARTANTEADIIDLENALATESTARATAVNQLTARIVAPQNEYANADLANGTYGFTPIWGFGGALPTVSLINGGEAIRALKNGGAFDGTMTRYGIVALDGGGVSKSAGGAPARKMWPVASGERIGFAVDGRTRAGSARWYLDVRWCDKNGAGSTSLGTAETTQGNTAWQRIGVVNSVPGDGYVWAEATIVLGWDGSLGTADMELRRPTFARLASTATALPAFSAPPGGGQIQALSASVTEQSLAIIDLENQQALASFRKIAEASGAAPAYYEFVSSTSGGYAAIAAPLVALLNSIPGGDPLVAMQAIAGEVFFPRPVYVDLGGRRLIVGPGNGWVLWFGPDTINAASATRTNGYFALGTDGQVYLGAAALREGGNRRSIVDVSERSVGSSWVNMADYSMSDVMGGADGVAVSATFSVTQFLFVPSGPGVTDYYGEYQLREMAHDGSGSAVLATKPFSSVTGDPTSTLIARGARTGAVRYQLWARSTLVGESASMAGVVDFQVAPNG